ncbi:MAG: UMP kinase, partial [Gammaproteobacteria bacterium]|nr:UMP kinase [Gammaproteobacteria bacterium]
VKGTRVDGVYDSDPEKNKSAKLYEHLVYDEVIKNKLAVMDTTAIVLCRDNDIPIRVFNMNKAGALMRVVCGEAEGTLVDKGD